MTDSLCRKLKLADLFMPFEDGTSNCSCIMKLKPQHNSWIGGETDVVSCPHHNYFCMPLDCGP